MADVTLTYQGATIAELDDSDSKTIRTAGKFCEADIGVEYVKPSGGANYEEQFFTGAYNGETVSVPYTSLKRLFSNTTGAFYLKAPNVETISVSYAFENSSIVTIFAPNAILSGQQRVFSGCSALTSAVFHHATGFSVFSGCAQLKSVDIQSSQGKLDNMFQTGCGSLDTLILRGSAIPTLTNTTAFASTKFKSGGAGGTIYIPKALYDHLGDGSSLDYKAATNWSTIDGYGTITWAAIEGSIYETQYADGTAITT